MSAPAKIQLGKADGSQGRRLFRLIWADYKPNGDALQPAEAERREMVERPFRTDGVWL